MKKFLFNIFRISIGIAILSALLYKIGFQDIYETLLKTSITTIGFILILYPVIFIIDTLNYYLILSSLEIKISFLRLLRHILLSSSFGLLTPARVGEFSLIYFFKKDDISLGVGTMALFIIKGITISILVLMASCGFIFFFDFSVAMRLIFILFIGILLIFYSVYSQKIRYIVKKYILRKYADRFKGFSSTLSIYLKEKKRFLFANFLLVFLRWFIAALIVYTLLVSFGSQTLYINVLLIHCIATIISLIPITISGLGIRETSAVYLFKGIGVNSISVASAYIILLAVNYLIAVLVLVFCPDRSRKLKEGTGDSE